jgi:hypothetical protein
MSAEAEISNFDTERFIVVHSKIALWDMTTVAYSNRDLKSWEEPVDIFMNQEKPLQQRKMNMVGLHF